MSLTELGCVRLLNVLWNAVPPVELPSRLLPLESFESTSEMAGERPVETQTGADEPKMLLALRCSEPSSLVWALQVGEGLGVSGRVRRGSSAESERARRT